MDESTTRREAVLRVRALLRRFLPDPRPPEPAGTPPPRSAYPMPLRPGQLRSWSFSIRRRGLDPAEVGALLHRVATELAVAQAALAAVREENGRIKDALRSWQSAQAPSAYQLARR